MSKSAALIPKEQMTAFDRWEAPSFDLSSDRIFKLPDAELVLIRQQAHEEAYRSGLESGYAAGVQLAHDEAAQIQGLLNHMRVALSHADELIAQSLLELAVEISQKMTGDLLLSKPEILLGVINQAISELPHFNQNAHLVLHPLDAELVQRMGEQLIHAGWKIFTDEKVQRGGCRIETAHSRVDATVEARWKRVMDSMGVDKSWMN